MTNIDVELIQKLESSGLQSIDDIFEKGIREIAEMTQLPETIVMGIYTEAIIVQQSLEEDIQAFTRSPDLQLGRTTLKQKEENPGYKLTEIEYLGNISPKIKRDLFLANLLTLQDIISIGEEELIKTAKITKQNAKRIIEKAIGAQGIMNACKNDSEELKEIIGKNIDPGIEKMLRDHLKTQEKIKSVCLGKDIGNFIDEQETKTNEFVDFAAILEFGKKKGSTRLNILCFLETLKREGTIYEPRSGYYSAKC